MSSESDSSDDESREVKFELGFSLKLILKNILIIFSNNFPKPLDVLIGRLETHDYDGHVALAKRARDEGELDHLRSIRTKFAAAFPLTGAIWLEWINDEIKLDDIGDLFERGVEDYLAA